jgi:hypothetical protein
MTALWTSRIYVDKEITLRIGGMNSLDNTGYLTY